jgi:hypothetical protein
VQIKKLSEKVEVEKYLKANSTQSYAHLGGLKQKNYKEKESKGSTNLRCKCSLILARRSGKSKV